MFVTAACLRKKCGKISSSRRRNSRTFGLDKEVQDMAVRLRCRKDLHLPIGSLSSILILRYSRSISWFSRE